MKCLNLEKNQNTKKKNCLLIQKKVPIKKNNTKAKMNLILPLQQQQLQNKIIKNLKNRLRYLDLKYFNKAHLNKN